MIWVLHNILHFLVSRTVYWGGGWMLDDWWKAGQVGKLPLITHSSEPTQIPGPLGAGEGVQCRKVLDHRNLYIYTYILTPYQTDLPGGQCV